MTRTPFSGLEFGHYVGIAASFIRQHFVQDLFHGHGMAANLPGGEECARTMPLPVFQAGYISIVLPSEFYAKVGEGNSIGFLSITFSFLDLPN